MIPPVAEGSIAPYFQGYVDRVDSDDVLGRLESLGRETEELYRDLSPERLLHRYAAGKWSVLELLGHVLDAERIFTTRALVFARGDTTSWPGFEEDDYVAAARFDARDPAHLLDEFLAQRAATLRFFEGLDAAQLASVGTANGVAFTAGSVAWILAGHHAHHLGVLRERYLD